MSRSTVETPIRRARHDHEKSERRTAILRAAGRLIDVRSRKLPAASDIAKEAGIAKGTLYLYFRTREEIYLALLGEWFTLCVDIVNGAITSADPSIENMLRRYTRFCAKNPNFVYLASMSATILEENISVDMAHAFKKGLADRVDPMCDAMAQAPEDVERYKRFFIHMFSLTTGLWQHCNPPESVERAYTRGGAELVRMDFETELYKALRVLFYGMQTTGRNEP